MKIHVWDLVWGVIIIYTVYIRIIVLIFVVSADEFSSHPQVYIDLNSLQRSTYWTLYIIYWCRLFSIHWLCLLSFYISLAMFSYCLPVSNERKYTLPTHRLNSQPLYHKLTVFPLGNCPVWPSGKCIEDTSKFPSKFVRKYWIIN